jgi:hypothetical protein
MTSVTSTTGLNISNSYDDNGDGVVDRIQSITTVVNANASRTGQVDAEGLHQQHRKMLPEMREPCAVHRSLLLTNISAALDASLNLRLKQS